VLEASSGVLPHKGRTASLITGGPYAIHLVLTSPVFFQQRFKQFRTTRKFVWRRNGSVVPCDYSFDSRFVQFAAVRLTFIAQHGILSCNDERPGDRRLELATRSEQREDSRFVEARCNLTESPEMNPSEKISRD